MKKLITILTITFLISSCETDKITITKEEYNKLIINKSEFELIIEPKYPKHLIVGNTNKSRAEFLIELGSDEYEYAHNINDYYDAYVCFHYPDCKKCKNDTL